MLSLDELRRLRAHVLDTHRGWKQRSTVSDQLVRGNWNKILDDLGIADEPMVEDIYTEALLDKSRAAAIPEPQVKVAPDRSTKGDTGENRARVKRQVFVSYMLRSHYDLGLRMRWFMDDWQHGAAFGVPWVQWSDAPRYPYFSRIDPRFVYPVSHSPTGRLRSVVVTRLRQLVDLRAEYGEDNPGLREVVAARFKGGKKVEDTALFEEVWFFDDQQWAMAVYDQSPAAVPNLHYVSPLIAAYNPSATLAWLRPPETHRLGKCPMVEWKYPTPTGEYVGRLDKMIPGLKRAHHLMSLVLRDNHLSVFAPVLMSNIENPEDFGPEAHLRATPGETGSVEYARPPVNFDAKDTVERLLDGTRNQGAFPQQRQGEFGASIASGKGVNAVTGAYNDDVGSSQMGHESFMMSLLPTVAAFDRVWTRGRKPIEGFDRGEHFSGRYDPAVMFREEGERLVHVSYGSRRGLDDGTHMTRLAIGRSFGMSDKTALELSGLVPDTESELMEATLGTITTGYLQHALIQATQGGNLEPLVRLVENLDAQKMTARGAIMEAIRTAAAVPVGGGGPGEAAGQDPLLQLRSLASGGVPGQAEGQPTVGPELAQAIPPSLVRAIGQEAPGGTAT